MGTQSSYILKQECYPATVNPTTFRERIFVEVVDRPETLVHSMTRCTPIPSLVSLQPKRKQKRRPIIFFSIIDSQVVCVVSVRNFQPMARFALIRSSVPTLTETDLADQDSNTRHPDKMNSPYPNFSLILVVFYVQDGAHPDSPSPSGGDASAAPSAPAATPSAPAAVPSDPPAAPSDPSADSDVCVVSLAERYIFPDWTQQKVEIRCAKTRTSSCNVLATMLTFPSPLP